MKKTVFLGLTLASILVLSLAFFLKGYLRPKTQREINPTVIERMEQAGALIFRRIYPDLKLSPIWILGSSPTVPGHELVWEGLVKTARAQGLKLVERKEPKVVPGEITVLKTLSYEALRSVEASLAQRVYRAAGNVRMLVLIQQVFPVVESQVQQLQPPCDPNSMNPVVQLNCAALDYATRFFRKKLDPDKHYVGLQKKNSTERLVFLSF